jgi:hypothetical protein
MKKLIFVSLFFLFNTNINAEFLFKLKNKQHQNSYNVFIEFGLNGFNSDGIHKITQTEYDEEGFNVNGYSIGGAGRSECRERDANNYARHHSQYNHHSYYIWEGQVAPYNSGNFYFTYVDLKDMYRYYKYNSYGYITEGSHIKYGICRLPVTRDYVIGLTDHPNVSLGSHDFYNFEYWTN